MATGIATERRQRLLAAVLAVGGIVVTVVASTSFVENVCRVRFSENLILREKPRAESAWEILETPSGSLIRAKHGPFAGWHLAADDLVDSTEPVGPGFTIIGSSPPTSPRARAVILRERKSPGCYWNLTETEDGIRIQPAQGRYTGWFLGFLEDYVPETGSDPRTAWNLILIREQPMVVFAGSEWKLTRGEEQCLIQAASGRTFEGWYLDCLHGAKVLERSRCWGEEKTRDGPAPPLAP